MSLPWSGIRGVHSRPSQAGSSISSVRTGPSADSVTDELVESGWKMPDRYAVSTAPHQDHPPHSIVASVTPPIAIANRALHRCFGSGASPGASTLSRTAAPKIVIAPTNKNIAAPMRPAAMKGFMSSRRSATAFTGTKTVPSPAAPDTVTCTL